MTIYKRRHRRRCHAMAPSTTNDVCSEYCTGLLKNAFYKHETARVRSFPPALLAVDIILLPRTTCSLLLFIIIDKLLFFRSPQKPIIPVKPFSELGAVHIT